MSVFQQLDFEMNDPDQRITVNKLECAIDYFGSKDQIVEFLNGIGDIKKDQDKTDKDLLLYIHEFLKTFPRIEKVEFYRGKSALVVLMIANRIPFDKIPFSKRNMTVEGKKSKFIISFVEILKSEYSDIENGKKKLPKSWKADNDLNKTYNRIQVLSQ